MVTTAITPCGCGWDFTFYYCQEHRCLCKFCGVCGQHEAPEVEGGDYGDYLEALSKSSTDTKQIQDEGFQAHFCAPPAAAMPDEDYVPLEEVFWNDEGAVQLELTPSCMVSAIGGEDSTGHYYAKALVCGRQWCEKCGGKGGAGHMRRVQKRMERIQQLKEACHMVISPPSELWESWKDVELLSKKQTAVIRLLKRWGVKRGFVAVHWYGDKMPEDGTPPRYHPHFDCVLDAGYIEPERLDDLKRRLAVVFGCQGDYEKVDVWCGYSSKPGRIYHMLYYALRPTFLDWRWDAHQAVAILGYRNARPFGTWRDKPVWGVEDIRKADVGEDEVDISALRKLQAIGKGICYKCGEGIQWAGHGVVSVVELEQSPDWTLVGAGYWEYLGTRPPIFSAGPSPFGSAEQRGEVWADLSGRRKQMSNLRAKVLRRLRQRAWNDKS